VVQPQLSSRIRVLQECANPVCRAQFRYLHQGKLFEVEIQYFDSLSCAGKGEPGNGKGQIERCWLCDRCAAYIFLRFDRQRGVLMASSAGRFEEQLTLESNGRATAEIQRVLIRPLSWDWPPRTGEKQPADQKREREKSHE
jgi:hypothetical protein